MRAIRAWLVRLSGVFASSRAEHDLTAELESHLQLHIDDNLRAGMTLHEARRRAVLALGGVEGTKEAVRDRRGIPIIESLVRDLRYAVRTLRRDAALATFAVLIIGIGVGASTTVFGVVNALWLRPLPFDDPSRLVWIANGSVANLSNQTVQSGHVEDLQRQTQSFDAIEGYSPFYNTGDITLTGKGEAERLTGVPVTQGFFPLLGVRLSLGRNFTAEECRFTAPRTAILSHAFWQRRTQADPDVIGSVLVLDGQPTTIVGVLPSSFDFGGTFSPGRPADVFRPFSLGPENNRRGNLVQAIGRLKPGVDLAAAAAETAATVERFTAIAPDVEPGRRRNTFRPELTPLQERISGGFHGTLALLAAAVALLLLLVAANISSLLLARASARQKEVALRMALGAGRARVVQQLIVEGMVLSCSGAALGLALAFAGTRLIANIEGAAIPLLANVRVDAPAVLFIIVVSIFTGVVFGLLPALQASAAAPPDALKDGSRSVVAGRAWLRRAIVVTEIVLVCVLLTGAGLLTRSLAQVLSVDPGFTSENVITMRVDPSRQLRLNRDARNRYFDALLAEVRSVPGVDDAGLTDALPLGDNYGWRGWSVYPAERYRDPAARQNPRTRMVDGRYLSTMRIGLKAGRTFSAADTPSSERVVIVNEGLAQGLWPGEDPLGRLMRTSGRDYRVIGVVNDVRYFALERETGPEMYMLAPQTGDYETIDLVVRSALPPASVIPSLRAALKRADPNLPVVDFKTMEQLVERSVFTRRVTVMLVAGFAGFGLLLAALGLYAVISYSVSRRTREIGVRMAIGAAPAVMRRQVLKQTLMLAVIGLAAGMPAAWMAARAMQGLLFGVVSSDLVTFLGVAGVVLLVAAIAGYVPARRASRIDPVLALRTE